MCFSITFFLVFNIFSIVCKFEKSFLKGGCFLCFLVFFWGFFAFIGGCWFVWLFFVFLGGGFLCVFGCF